MQNKMNPKFSIIVPVYKVEKYIHKCMESLIGQTYPNYEIVLVDDGSPDQCGAICDSYAQHDDRIRVIHKENGGLVSARKAGAAECTGDYVVNVDSDDFIAQDLLERLFAIIKDYTPDVICYDGYRFTEDTQTDFCGTLPAGLYKGEKLKKIHDSVIQDEKHEIAIVYGICLKAVRRDLYLKYQMAVPPEISIGEDLAVTAPLLVQCNSVYISGIQGYFYRDNPKSIMNTFRKNEVEQIRLLTDFLLSAMGEKYQDRIDTYILSHYFDFLDRALISLKRIRPYKQLIAETADKKIMASVKRAKCTSPRLIDQLVFWLMRNQCFTTIWILRHIKKR